MIQEGRAIGGVHLIKAEQAPLLARPYYASGDPGPIVAALAHVPELLEVAMPFLGAALGPSWISARAKELVILRTSARLACRFCVQTHTVAARDTGLALDEVRALRGELPLEAAFDDPHELALLDWVDTVALGPGPVPDSARAAVRVWFGDAELVELTLLVGATVLLNRFCTALDLPTSPQVLARLAQEGLA
ncbi:MAG TPA: carboxymuconolactone decarboxylase family protein [Actinomycetes bacterium]|jgi:AhpD family alkylhydroperoxidase|nr:carboxymuconolactone decarboxylase family protein [Actinomycetes bacterium]